MNPLKRTFNYYLSFPSFKELNLIHLAITLKNERKFLLWTGFEMYLKTKDPIRQHLINQISIFPECWLRKNWTQSVSPACGVHTRVGVAFLHLIFRAKKTDYFPMKFQRPVAPVCLQWQWSGENPHTFSKKLLKPTSLPKQLLPLIANSPELSLLLSPNPLLPFSLKSNQAFDFSPHWFTTPTLVNPKVHS